MAPKHTTKTEKNRESANNEGVRIVVDGVSYAVREADLTSLDISALRREVCLSFVGLMGALQGDQPDIDLLAALVWLARRQDGEQMLTYAAVAKEITYDSDFDVERITTPPEEDPQT